MTYDILGFISLRSYSYGVLIAELMCHPALQALPLGKDLAEEMVWCRQPIGAHGAFVCGARGAFCVWCVAGIGARAHRESLDAQTIKTPYDLRVTSQTHRVCRMSSVILSSSII